MKKEDKVSAKSQMNTKSVQSQAEQTLKPNNNIKDYSRAWEDDRL